MWSACVWLSSVRTIRTPSCSEAARYRSIAKDGSTTTASCVSSSPTRYDAQPRSSSTNCLKITASTVTPAAACFPKALRLKEPASQGEESRGGDQRGAAERGQHDQPA